MQEEVFDQNDGSESAADESGAKKKRRGVLYIISASAVVGRLLVHAGLATETDIIIYILSLVWQVRDAAPMSGIATPSAPIAGSAYVLATMMSMCAVMLPCFAFGYSLQKL